MCPELGYVESEIETLFETLDRTGAFDAPQGELSIAFVGKGEISRIHNSFMGDPSPTDVITFPGDTEIEQAGEIVVCPQVAKEFAERENLDFPQELSLYLIHGYLHLCGFDDIAEEDRAQMRLAEQQALSLVTGKLPHFTLEDEIR